MIGPAQTQFEFTSHNNAFLFSDHYLGEILRRSPAWRNATAAGLDFRAWLKPLYEHEKEHLGGYSESQLEDHWIKPILSRLGHTL